MSEFNNLQVAYADKNKKELYKAYFLFKLVNYSLITQILTQILKLALLLRLPINRLIKWSIYTQFCGGTTIENSQSVIEKLWRSGIGTILDYSAEGKETDSDFKTVTAQTIESIEKAKNTESIPFAVFKLTGISSYSLLKKLNTSELLNNNEKENLEKLNIRVDKICESASKNNVRLFIDAEESWIQDAIDNLVLKMMRKYNKNRIIIYNTIQLYRNDRINYLKNLISICENESFFAGIKLVRGAYHEKEIERSDRLSYPCPVHKKKEDTDKDYDLSINICIQNINKIAICAGTHNERSSAYLMELMKKYKINKKDDRVYFSQLYGMSDHISYNLSNAGYNVAKYVPYGPIRDVIPYLIRRLKENTSIGGQVNRELQNIKQEIKRRKRK